MCGRTVDMQYAMAEKRRGKKRKKKEDKKKKPHDENIIATFPIPHGGHKNDQVHLHVEKTIGRYLLDKMGLESHCSL